MGHTDTAYDVETPEGVILKMRSAGLPVRFYAYLIDVLIRWGINMIVIVVASMFESHTSQGLLLIYIFFMEWFYPVYFEVYRKGQTPGKKNMKIKVLNGDGTPIGWQSSLIRNFLVIIDIYFFGFISSLLDKRFRRLGDLAGDTVVVYEKDIIISELPKSKSVYPPVNLSINEQKAVIAFAERYKMLSDSRKKELAEILKGLHNESKGNAVKAIIQYAAALSGKTGQ